MEITIASDNKKEVRRYVCGAPRYKISLLGITQALDYYVDNLAWNYYYFPRCLAGNPFFGTWSR